MRAHRQLKSIFIAVSYVLGGSAHAVLASEHLTHEATSILVTACLECHGGDQKGGLDLRTRETAVRGGESGDAIIPGIADESLLLELVRSHEMPPKNPLTEEQVGVLKTWIAAGAHYPDKPLSAFSITTDRRAGYDWWALQPLAETTPPEPPELPDHWKDNPIDRFIFAKMQSAGLSPSPPADPRTLVRRATYDLLGLPPSPQEVETFVKDCEVETGAPQTVGTNAYASLIDRLLASPHYGEHWGRHWLDVVRFGESNGFERNVIINNVWPFRDYVIRSFNDDKPFDRFIIEHLAGDAIAPDDPEVAVGTTFLVCGPYDNVGNQDPVQAAQIRADGIDEMIRATTSAFLGFTVGCSRCHDHKFDPISQRDYYRLYATFAGVRHGDREIPVPPDPKLAQQTEAVIQQLASIDLQLFQFEPVAAVESGDAAKQPVRRPVNPQRNSERISPTHARFVRFIVTATNSLEPCLDELEVFTVDGESEAENIARLPGTRVSSSGNYDGNPKHQLKHITDGRYGNERSWISDEAGRGWVQLEFPSPFTIERIVWGRDRLGKYQDRLPTEYTIQVSTDGRTWQTVASSADRRRYDANTKIPDRHAVAGLDADQATLAAELLDSRRELTEQLRQLQKQAAPPRWWIGQFVQHEGPYHTFVGGSPQRKGNIVQPSSLRLVSGAAADYRLESSSPEKSRRLALAKWITAEDQPITPRVLANRVWHYHFGAGIVNTPSDLGFMGGRPSHPYLLDWLALELKRQRWRLKPLHKLIMLSQTYRQTSDYRADAAQVDGESRLLWRFPPRRLSAEEIRDSMLSIAGKLDGRRGGPGFRLFRYVQDNVATYYPLDQHGPETYRRAVYHHNARAMHVDLMTEFDAPDCAFATPRRSATTTPLQALSLLNHSFTIDMSEFLAERIRREAGAERSRQISTAFMLTFLRLPDKAELAAAEKLIEAHGLRALCRALLNANELMYLN